MQTDLEGPWVLLGSGSLIKAITALNAFEGRWDERNARGLKKVPIVGVSK
jgi:hypothetical protein